MNGRELLERMRRDDLVLSMSLRVGMGNPTIEVARDAYYKDEKLRYTIPKKV
jgi:hypothetical protein